MAIYFIEMEGLNLLKIGFTESGPDLPPAWQGEIDDLRGLIHARIKN